MCPNVRTRTREKEAYGKRARAGLLARVDWPQSRKRVADAVLNCLPTSGGVVYFLFPFVRFWFAFFYIFGPPLRSFVLWYKNAVVLLCHFFLI